MPPISSFAVLDHLINPLFNKHRYPKLSSVKLIGFSAGAQLVQRYVFFNQLSGPVSFVSISPSSYLYFSQARLQQANGCKRYNDYRYGLQKLPQFLLHADLNTLAQRYAQETITYVVGLSDIKEELMLDKTCMANLQGANRLTRAKNYWLFLKKYYHSSPHNQAILFVNNVGHNQDDMLSHAPINLL